MKNLIRLSIALLVNTGLQAQLADWKPVSGTKFPTNNVWQINGMTRIVQMKFHVTDPQKMYAITSEGGMFTTNDSGNSWQAAAGTEHLTGSCASICIDYTNDQTIWLGGGDPNYYTNGAGVLKSTDGGKSFQPTGLTNRLVVDISQHPNNPLVLVAATNGGVYRTDDGGNNWTTVLASGTEFCHLIAGEGAFNEVLFATSHELNPKLFRSADFGQTWTQITSGIGYATTHKTQGGRVAVTPADPNIVVFEVIGGGGIIHKSVDGGLNFNIVKAQGAPFLNFYDDDSGSSGQGNYDNAINIDRTNADRMWLQAHNTWRSEDGGNSWQMLTHWASEIHTDMHQIEQSPHDPAKLYSCNDGGVWLSENNGENWRPVSDGIFAFEIANRAGTSSPVQADFVSIGTQDNARLYGTSEGWFTISGGDDYAPRQIDYNGYVYYEGQTRQANHTGNTSAYGLPVDWNVFAFNHTDKNLGFMGENEIYRCRNLTDNQTDWEAISNFNKFIRAIHSCIADPNRLYAINPNQKLYVCRNALDANPIWETKDLPFSSSSSAHITAMCNNADIIYVTLGSRAYRSYDAGTTWENITYNLPTVIHKRILSEEYGGEEELVFVGTNNAVYYRKKTDTLWTIYTTGLPTRRAPTEVSMFDDGTNAARIRYATYGRGMWESPFGNLRQFKPDLAYESSLISCETPQINFKDASLGISDTAVQYQWTFDQGSPAISTEANPKVQFPKTGTYQISLTVSQHNQSQTITREVFVEVQGCQPDTFPGYALQTDANGAYALTPALDMGTGTDLTLMTWLKIEQIQNDFAGILFSANGGATGLNFRYNNQLGYHYNGEAATWSFGNGPFVPLGTWVHVALVTTSDSATLYLDGEPFVHHYQLTPITFDQPFRLGNDRGFDNRTMHGQLDEVCIYNRALSTLEIRENMHLTKNQKQTDPGLKLYYQFNESGNSIQDRVGTLNASTNAPDMQVVSTAPVGAGSCECKTWVTNGITEWANEGFKIEGASAMALTREMCLTRLRNNPDSMPTGKAFPEKAPGYWIQHSYNGINNSDETYKLQLTPLADLKSEDEQTPHRFHLYRRAAGAYLAQEWQLIDSANKVNANTDQLHFEAIAVLSGDKYQYALVPEKCETINVGDLSLLVYPNPVRGMVKMLSNHHGTVWLINEKGQPVKSIELCENTVNYINLSELAQGVYVLKGTFEGQEISTRIVVY